MIDRNSNVDEFLQHYGVLGMKWGVRNGRPTIREANNAARTERRKASSKLSRASGTSAKNEPRITSEQKHAAIRLTGVAAGTLAVAAGVSYAGYSLAKNGKVNTKLLDNKLTRRALNSGSNVALARILSDKSTISHYSRGKNTGPAIIKSDGRPPPERLYMQAKFPPNNKEVFKKFDDGSNRIAVRFADPEGRRDRFGQRIRHEVIIPQTMSDGLNDINDVKIKIWPLLKEDYDNVYNMPKEEL